MANTDRPPATLDDVRQTIADLQNFGIGSPTTAKLLATILPEYPLEMWYTPVSGNDGTTVTLAQVFSEKLGAAKNSRNVDVVRAATELETKLGDSIRPFAELTDAIKLLRGVTADPTGDIRQTMATIPHDNWAIPVTQEAGDRTTLAAELLGAIRRETERASTAGTTRDRDRIADLWLETLRTRVLEDSNVPVRTHPSGVERAIGNTAPGLGPIIKTPLTR